MGRFQKKYLVLLLGISFMSTALYYSTFDRIYFCELVEPPKKKCNKKTVECLGGFRLSYFKIEWPLQSEVTREWPGVSKRDFGARKACERLKNECEEDPSHSNCKAWWEIFSFVN